MSRIGAMLGTVIFAISCAGALAAVAGRARGDEPAVERSDEPLAESFLRDAKPFLERYCLRCHNAEEMMSGIRVDQLDASLEQRQLRLWEGVRRQIDRRAMPPEDEPQPTADERTRVVEWITRALDVARARPVPKNGGVRRLTVSQYRNTLRELLLLEDDLTDQLPPDAVSKDGFLNNQEALQLSPLQLEAYFEIADRMLDRCLVDADSKPVIQEFRVELGAGINAEPCPDQLILGANSSLLDNADFVVTQPTRARPFDFEPLRMRTRYRFIEGYQGNDTVRGWRDYDSIYHAVFACMRGSDGYPKGEAWSVVPEGLLLRPAIPSEELFQVDSTYGPKANFKISLRELPDDGRFRVTVTAARYDDGLLLDAGDPAAPENGAGTVVCSGPGTIHELPLDQSGIYQVDVYATASDGGAAPNCRLSLDERRFSGQLRRPAFLAVRLPAGRLRVNVALSGNAHLERIVLTPLDARHDLAERFQAFEKRSPQLGVHLGLRRDCGSTLARVGTPQAVSSGELTRYVFEGAIRNFPSPDVERDNVNYLAGIREIGVRSEYTDGRDLPRLLIRSVQFEGPCYESWPPRTHRNLMLDVVPGEATRDDARRILRRFATRAYRRPVTDAEEASLLAVFDRSFRNRPDFLLSIKDALAVVLTSPQFLFLVESSTTPEPEPLDDFELASKLAYFLWDGPPDEPLTNLAAAGQLRSQLDAQVDRMIGDPRFARFADQFASQWLALEKFDVVEPDRQRFPRLTRDTRAQLRREPAQLLLHLIRRNMPLEQLIRSDFIVANEVVAAYYGLADRVESGFEFQPVPHGRPELGGVLTQAAILAGLSDGREPNPVKRGAWLARRIIAEPPDDPPPNVPALAEDTRELPLRQRLERHRNQPGCAECHARIDPWGLPFEQFDAGGRLRAEPVDASSTLPDATDVRGVDELKRYLAEDRLDQVAYSLRMHLTTYAAGRSLAYNELELLRRESVQLKANGYRLGDMLRSVVHSPVFLEK